jgi:uncharacterized protein (TIGR02453 family)
MGARRALGLHVSARERGRWRAGARGMSRDEDIPPPPFDGFPDAAFAFFDSLAAHQDRAWMADNKVIHEGAARVPMAALVADLTERLAAAGSPLRGDPWRSQFRLNRDVRFSKDKRPYKTHASAVLTRTDDKSAPGVLYIHVDPKGSFAAAGFFQPEPKVLAALRNGLVDDCDGWSETIAALADAGLAPETDNALVRSPKGFAGAPPECEAALKLKSWVVRRELPRVVLACPALVEALLGLASAAAPLLEFGWSAIERHPP